MAKFSIYLYILKRVKDWLWDRDWEWVNSHSAYHFYKDIIPNKYSPANHLCLDMSMMKKRLISQCRVNSPYVRINAVNYYIKGNCVFCECDNDSLIHVLFSCVAHEASRYSLCATQLSLYKKQPSVPQLQHSKASKETPR